MRSALLVLLLLAGCPTGGDPQPVTPDPAPVGTGGMPAPSGSPCEDMCVRRSVLHCDGAGAGCVETCERYQEMAIESPALDEHPSCQARAASCKAADACRAH